MQKEFSVKGLKLSFLQCWRNFATRVKDDEPSLSWEQGPCTRLQTLHCAQFSWKHQPFQSIQLSFSLGLWQWKTRPSSPPSAFFFEWHQEGRQQSDQQFLQQRRKQASSPHSTLGLQRVQMVWILSASPSEIHRQQSWGQHMVPAMHQRKYELHTMHNINAEHSDYTRKKAKKPKLHKKNIEQSI